MLDFVVDSPQFIIVEVTLVEDDSRRDVVGLCSDKQAVDETSGGARKAQCGDEAEQVDIGGDDVSLLGEFGGTTDDVVVAVGDVGNHARAVVEELERDAVADGYGVGLFAATETVVATETAVESSAVVGEDAIPATCGTYN